MAIEIEKVAATARHYLVLSGPKGAPKDFVMFSAECIPAPYVAFQ